MQAGPILCLLVSLGVLVLLIARWKWPAFLALIICSLGVGLGVGMKLTDVIVSFQTGLGSILSSIAMVVGLGAVLGKLLQESGGAEVMARKLIGLLGPEQLHWTMMLTGFVIGIPVWFSVGVVLLTPVLFSVARDSGQSLIKLAVPMLAGLSVAHGLIPPHPGPVAAIGSLKADAGKVVFYSILVGFPTAILGGPLIAGLLKRWAGDVGIGSIQESQKPDGVQRPGFGITLVTILLPVILMLVATVADLTLPLGNRVRLACDFVGSPLVSMLVSVVVAFYTLGFGCGYNRDQILKFCENSLWPVATVLLVVGAGGGFNRVLVDGGIGKLIESFVKGASFSPLIMGWGVAALIRVATGSATLGITTAAGIMGPVVAATPGANVELLVVAMGAGSLILSHLNDGGFWFVKEYLGLSVPQTLRTWTVLETVMAVGGLAGVLVIDWLF